MRSWELERANRQVGRIKVTGHFVVGEGKGIQQDIKEETKVVSDVVLSTDDAVKVFHRRFFNCLTGISNTPFNAGADLLAAGAKGEVEEHGGKTDFVDAKNTWVGQKRVLVGH